MPTIHTSDSPTAFYKPSVLLFDHQDEERKALAAALEHDGFEVHDTTNLGHAQPGHIETVDAVVSNLGDRENGTGIQLLRSWRHDCPDTPVIAIVSDNRVGPAVEAMRVGAADCISQPVHPERLTAALRRVLSIRRSDARQAPADRTSKLPNNFEGIIGGCHLMQQVYEQAERVAPTSSTVLISGSTGTGKELLAQAIHRLSRRSTTPLMAVNVAAVPSTLIESELFGHVKGAFTDAVTERIGRFEAANGGTLFIDEIGDLKLQSQAKLLRVLESRVINRVGSNEDIPVDVRMIAATSRNLERLVKEGQFRPDLYYRLNVVRIELPDLQRRREDISLLVTELLQALSGNQNLPLKRIDPELMEFLQSHPWPGNVRQLRNCLESMLVMSHDDVLTTADLPDTIEMSSADTGVGDMQLAGCRLAELERQAILQTLEHNRGNRTHTADMLGISVRTLQRKLKGWDMQGEDFGA